MDMQSMQAFASMDTAAMEAASAGVAVAGIVVALVAVFFLLVMPIIMGILCRKLARHKGYTGYFWMGFFLGMLALIYVCGLPDLNARKDMRAVLKRLASTGDRLSALEDQQFTRQY